MTDVLEAFGRFVAMDGDGAYVWSAYGITLAAMLWNAWSAARLHRRNIARARRSADAERPARTPTVRQLQ